MIKLFQTNHKFRGTCFSRYLFLGLTLGLAFSSLAEAEVTPSQTVLLMDKKKNELSIAIYPKVGMEPYKIVKKFRATYGKVVGDKTEEGDLKTPEGVYLFSSLLKPPSIKPKFGVMAFYMNYPNPFDRLAGQTGFDIMLHATNEPSRLKKDFDSEGCIVVKNEELEEIRPYIQLNLTPILVFSNLDQEFMFPDKDGKLNSFFRSWINAWETKNIDSYISHYHTNFRSSGKNKRTWRNYKNSLNKVYAEIHVKPEKIQFFRHPKYSVVMFIQNYKSILANGRVGHKGSGTKALYIAEENGQLKIIDEDYTTLKW